MTHDDKTDPFIPSPLQTIRVTRPTNENESRPTKISIADYRDAESSMMGWCTECKEFTHESAEPDAEEYECPGCGERTVYGAQQAMLLGLIYVTE